MEVDTKAEAIKRRIKERLVEAKGQLDLYHWEFPNDLKYNDPNNNVKQALYWMDRWMND